MRTGDSESTTSSFTALVAEELHQARAANPPFHNLHEGYAVLLEEVDELWDEIKKKRAVRSPAKLTEEVVQIAAMCQRLYEDVIQYQP